MVGETLRNGEEIARRKEKNKSKDERLKETISFQTDRRTDSMTGRRGQL